MIYFTQLLLFYLPLLGWEDNLHVPAPLVPQPLHPNHQLKSWCKQESETLQALVVCEKILNLENLKTIESKTYIVQINIWQHTS